jgi:hypothetical protein
MNERRPGGHACRSGALINGRRSCAFLKVAAAATPLSAVAAVSAFETLRPVMRLTLRLTWISLRVYTAAVAKKRRHTELVQRRNPSRAIIRKISFLIWS